MKRIEGSWNTSVTIAADVPCLIQLTVYDHCDHAVEAIQAAYLTPEAARELATALHEAACDAVDEKQETK